MLLMILEELSNEILRNGLVLEFWPIFWHFLVTGAFFQIDAHCRRLSLILLCGKMGGFPGILGPTMD